MKIKELVNTGKTKLEKGLDDAASNYYNKVASTRVATKLSEIEERNSKKEGISKDKILSKKEEIKKSTEDKLSDYIEGLFTSFDDKATDVKKHVKRKKQ